MAQNINQMSVHENSAKKGFFNVFFNKIKCKRSEKLQSQLGLHVSIISMIDVLLGWIFKRMGLDYLVYCICIVWTYMHICGQKNTAGLK